MINKIEIFNLYDLVLFYRYFNIARIPLQLLSS